MTARYSVIRYVPNPANDECVNVGVIAFDDSEVHVEFDRQLRRARALSSGGLGMLRGAIDDIRARHESNKLDPETIWRLSETWIGQVQFSRPRESQRRVRELLQEVRAHFLVSSPAPKAGRLGKRRAIKLAYESLTTEICSRFQTSKAGARKAIHRDFTVAGKLEEHDLDLAIVNGHVGFGAVAVSLAHESRNQLKREVDAVAFAIEDVLRSRSDIQLAVLAYSEGVEAAAMDKVVSLFGNWDVPVVPNAEIPSWSRTTVERLPVSIEKVWIEDR